MINLFEYCNKVHLEEKPEYIDGLENFLDEIWQRRDLAGGSWGNDNTNGHQQFIDIDRHCNLKSGKYLGVIRYNGNNINLLPKIFYEGNADLPESRLMAINDHILWWLSYCKRVKFPKSLSGTSRRSADWLELLIYMFAKYTMELLNHSLYRQYEEVSEELINIKGRIDFDRYLSRNLTTGRWHKVNCTYEPFVLDNSFNRIVKYVASLLRNATNNPDNKCMLGKILFMLDDVSNCPATADECDRICFNAVFSEFETVRDYCSLFLRHSISVDYNNELKLFAFLLPTDYLFEDFICGFIQKELPDFQVASQSKSEKLDTLGAFTLKPDLIRFYSKKLNYI